MLKNTLSQSWQKFNIKGFQEVSLLEWEGRLTSILFLPGCNLRCPFCHAKDLVLDHEKTTTVPFEQVAEYLNTRKGWVDGVAITGGEPTLCDWLFDLIDEIKKLKFSVMLETNGTSPETIKELLDTKRIDYIAMDVKTSFDEAGTKYKKATGTCVNIDNIKKSIDVIISSDINYEFRTTIVPGIINVTDIENIAKHIKGAKKLCLQQFYPNSTLDPDYAKIKAYPREMIETMVKKAGQFVETVIIKNQ